MDPKLIVEAMQQGVGFVCAHCDKFWEGARNGLHHCMAAEQRKPCVGPISGGTFPEYSGPLEEVMSDHCFVCGHRATHSVIHQGAVDSRKVGVCDTHLEWLRDYSVGGDRPQFITKKKIDLRE